MNYSRLSVVITFICLGIVSRFLPHPPNFTAINSIALFGIWSLRNLKLSLTLVFAAMFVSDYLIGFHSTMSFVYLSFGGVVFLGHWLNSEKVLTRLPILCVASSLLFFLFTNFGVWLTTSLYPKTMAGLILCYIAAIPFLVNQVLGDLVYSLAMFGSFVLAEKYAPMIRIS